MPYPNHPFGEKEPFLKALKEFRWKSPQRMFPYFIEKIDAKVVLEWLESIETNLSVKGY